MLITGSKGLSPEIWRRLDPLTTDAITREILHGHTGGEESSIGITRTRSGEAKDHP